MTISTTDEGRVYTVPLPVLESREIRDVRILFRRSSTEIARVTVDGPSSPHRYDDGTLCMWHPWDPRANRWVFDDQLLTLLGHIQLHLFRESWWRQSGEWLGPEAPHADPKTEETGDARAAV